VPITRIDFKRELKSAVGLGDIGHGSQTVNTILQWILDKIPFDMINFTNKYVLENWAMGLISITILAKKQYCYTAEETMSNLQLIC